MLHLNIRFLGLNEESIDNETAGESQSDYNCLKSVMITQAKKKKSIKVFNREKYGQIFVLVINAYCYCGIWVG